MFKVKVIRLNKHGKYVTRYVKIGDTCPECSSAFERCGNVIKCKTCQAAYLLANKQ